MTAAGEAAARASGVGKRAMSRVQASAARDAWVCWAMTSETSTDHGSEVRRKARARAFAAYQPRTADCIRATSAAAGPAPTASVTCLRYRGAIRCGLLDPADRLAAAPRGCARGRARGLRQPL